MNLIARESRYRPPCPYCGVPLDRVDLSGPFVCPHCRGALEAQPPGGNWYYVSLFATACLAAYGLGLRGFALAIAILPAWLVATTVVTFVLGLFKPPRPRRYYGSMKDRAPRYLTLGLSGPSSPGESADPPANPTKDT
jgi:hypothetical protein